MLFGTKEKLAIECELTDTSVDYFFGRVRIWFGGLPLGDFSGEIVSTQMFGAEAMWEIGQRPPAPAELAGCPSAACVAEARGLYSPNVCEEAAASRWLPYDFTNAFPYVDALCLLIPLDVGHRIVLGLPSGDAHEVRLDAGELDAACLGISHWIQSQPGYGAGTTLKGRRPT